MFAGSFFIDMKLIIGLGNPGREYKKTRHNMGRRLAEFLAEKEGHKFRRLKSLEAHVAEMSWENAPSVVVAYVETYMNLSGKRIRPLFDHYEVSDLQDLLIVVDDIALPFGKMRLRAGGSAGGHNGLASIEEAFQSAEYPRLRLGIGIQHEEHPERSAGTGTYEPMRDYVLSEFSSAEEKDMTAFLERGAESCQRWASGPFEKAVQWVNSAKS